MNHHRAVAIAIQALEREIKKLAVNANLEDTYHSGVPACIAASARRKELRAVIEVLKRPEQTRMKLS